MRLGDANIEAYDCAMDMLKRTVEKLTPIAAVQDGMGLEDRIQTNRGKEKEVLPARATGNACGSDAEGSAIGSFVGLKAPERKRKSGRPTTSRDKPPYDDHDLLYCGLFRPAEMIMSFEHRRTIDPFVILHKACRLIDS